MLQVVINIYWVTAWLKIHEELPWWYSGWESACQGRGTRIQSQIWEDPMCWEAAKSGSHTCWRPCLEPVLHERGHRSCDKDCPCSLQPELRAAMTQCSGFGRGVGKKLKCVCKIIGVFQRGENKYQNKQWQLKTLALKKEKRKKEDLRI